MSHSLNSLDLQQLAARAESAAGLLRALSNPNRLMILCSLQNQELCVSELNERIPLSQSALSQHLAALRKAGLVNTRKKAQAVYYHLQGEEAMQIIHVLHNIYCAD